MGNKKAKQKNKQPKKKKNSFLKDVVIIILAALVLNFIIRGLIVDSRTVPTASMYPTVAPKDRIIMSKLSYIFDNVPERGDVIVFTPPAELNEKSDLLKRVIGLPGETVEVRDNLVYIDGEPLKEPYIYEAPNYIFGPVTVPEDSYLVFGDNRNSSLDSHLWIRQFVNIDSIKGKALFIFWPIDRMGGIYVENTDN